MLISEQEKLKKNGGETMTFKETCKKMGGEYEEEYGLLEPDVGGEFITEHEAMKQWCTFTKMEGLGENELVVFNAPNTFSIKVQDKDMNELIDLWDNDVRKRFDAKNQTMCFEAVLGVRVPKGNFCVKTFPIGEPKGIEIKIEPSE